MYPKPFTQNTSEMLEHPTDLARCTSFDPKFGWILGKKKLPTLVVEPTHLKNMLVKLGIISLNSGENKKCLKPQPSYL